MNSLDILFQLCLLAGGSVIYLLFIKKWKPYKGVYKTIGWRYPIRLLRARYFVKSWKSQLTPAREDTLPRTDIIASKDSCTFRASAPDGATLLLGIKKLSGRQPIAEVTVHVKLADGTTYKLPQHPDTAVCSWQDAEGCWSANGLKIYVLEENKRYRVLYNGVLTRVGDEVTQHVKLNLLWATGSHPNCHPNDWSDELAAEALALQPGLEDKWKELLQKYTNGGWVRWGALQGRVQSFSEEGTIDQNVYLRTRGIVERSWVPEGSDDLKSSVSIVATATDGTAIYLKCAAYKESLNHCVSGCVRFPNSAIGSISSTDFVLSDFTDRADLAKVYVVNVGSKGSIFNLVLKLNADGGKLFSGVPYQQEIVYRTAEVIIGNSAGFGILEVSREPSVVPEQSVRIAPPRVLRWLDEEQAGAVSYCVPFEERAAASPMLVGGKGASLALLASVQNVEGYHVPPGFSLTTRALEKYLESNPNILAAIKDIEATNEDYNEEDFKSKCERTVELFGATEIQGEVKDEIMRNMKELRIKATEQKLGSELRFAVRSSAVGEDSEELSAAGQNDTILGCVSDDDILRGVQKCWGSMFAFTSTYYRRQNGQPCVCGGGVVVQAMVRARAAGVMFTRHPAAGDPARLLITANYGLGESVVSGAVEPDTIIVKRGLKGELAIARTEVGTKTSRVKAAGSGVATEDVPENERNVACLSNEEIMKLAKIGVAQEQLWGAGRDIEWAVTENQIYLLQARPITSLERWTEEELLHELDTAIMSDDELMSFGNTGEVLPKALTPLSYDVVTEPLSNGMDEMVNIDSKEYTHTMVITHNRCALPLYSTIYRLCPEEIDIGLRMIEMALHGHNVADQQILDIANKRYQSRWYTKLLRFIVMLKAILLSKKKVDDSLEAVKNLNYDFEASDPETVFRILNSDAIMKRFAFNHALTSTASSGSQIIAMNIFLEGKSEFSPEQCSEVCSLFTSGDVLSAEVPLLLAKLTQKLIASGLAEEFRAQDPKKAMQWLKTNIPDLYQDVNNFLEEHGHRAIMEFDLHTKPWVLVPEEMMKVLQNLRVTTDGVKPAKTIDDILDSLKTIEKPVTKKILRWVLPLCQRSVRHRESTKAQLILSIHKLRLGYLKLGRLLVKNWYMPHPDIIFFFRREELANYIRKRDPALLKKAMQRQQYHQGWCKLKFNELNAGWVETIKTLPPQVTTGDVKIKATSVCGGEVIARACVVKDLSEIGDLKEGDVLITHSTDIGWSPYFPLLTGIVTELGGLISHGAVIAREYGLPCIVGAAQATDIFKTGDIVRLSGIQGSIERVIVEDKLTDIVPEGEKAESVPNV